MKTEGPPQPNQHNDQHNEDGQIDLEESPKKSVNNHGINSMREAFKNAKVINLKETDRIKSKRGRPKKQQIASNKETKEKEDLENGLSDSEKKFQDQLISRIVDNAFSNVSADLGKELASALEKELGKFPDLSESERSQIIDDISVSFPSNQDIDSAINMARSSAEKFTREADLSQEHLKATTKNDKVEEQPPTTSEDSLKQTARKILAEEQAPPRMTLADEEKAVKEDETKRAEHPEEPEPESESESETPSPPSPPPPEESEKAKTGAEAWEELSDAEKQARLDRRVELRERLREFKNARVNLAVLERKSSRLALGRLYRGSYERALENYNERRAGYIGARAWRMLKERERSAEEKSLLWGNESFEKVRSGWKWLGDQNLEKLTRGTRFEAKGKWGRRFQRYASARTAISMGLLGASVVGGAGAAPALAILSARRVMSGAGAAFTSYDLMKLASEKGRESRRPLAKEEAQRMSMPQIEERMAELEAQARFSGRRTLKRDGRYQVLKQAYFNHYKKARSEVLDLAKNIENIDNYVRLTTSNESAREESLRMGRGIDQLREERESELLSRQRKMKTAAVGIGAVVGNVSLLGRLLPGVPGTENVTAEAIQGQINNEPLIPPDEVEGMMEEQDSLPEEVLDIAENVEVEVPANTPGIRSSGGYGGFNVVPENTLANEEMVGQTFLKPDDIPIGTNADTGNPFVRAIKDGVKGLFKPEEVSSEVDGGALDSAGIDVGHQEKLNPLESKWIGPEVGDDEISYPRVDMPDAVQAQKGLMGGGIDNSNDVVPDGWELIESPFEPEVIQKGEGLWHAAQRMVESGNISREEFMRAGSSSTVELESGTTIPIAEAGLVREGDQIIYVPETGDTPAHFEVTDYAGDNLHIGSNKELAEAFDAAGREKPEWLQKALAVEMPETLDSSDLEQTASEAPSPINQSENLMSQVTEADIDAVDASKIEGVTSAEDLETENFIKEAERRGVPADKIEELLAGEKEVAEAAAEAKLEAANSGLDNLAWGSVEFITNDKGEVVDMHITESLSPYYRQTFIGEASDEVLDPNFERVLERDITGAIRAGLESRELLEKTIHVKEAAWRVFQLQDMLRGLPEGSEEWHFAKGQIDKIVKPTIGNDSIFNGHFLNTNVFNQANLVK